MSDSRDVRIVKAKKAFVTTPSVAKVLRYMDRCRDLSDMDSDPTCMMVYGDTGVGKTAIIKKYLKKNEGDSDSEGDTIPVLHIELPDNAKPVDAARELLLQMGDPLALYDTDLARLTNKIVKLVPILGVRLIIIDEFQHLVDDSTNKILTHVGNWLKGILNKTKCPIILFGMPYSKVVLRANSQLHGRFAIQFHLRPFSYQNGEGVFKIFLQHLDEALPFEKQIGLAKEGLQKKLYAFSQGNMRSLRDLIYQASIEAIDNDHESITDADFLFASELTSGNKPSFWKNPFIEGVKVTREMLRSPPKTLGWENYLKNISPKTKGRKGLDLFD
ncbi:TPA: TniB family NTP-binding protein [Vibrio parahaemolyticus]|uniref:TniB family NTP-binding protein n=2 Tax=Vibrio parahaemolyticus TaxID=670 RepID=UPI0011200930|nr:TniB family NTP-binding protein [Vibrio parahaemolyticus]MBE3714898.1 AAA family ATPase [Vibrio parahaemolyticus]TOH82426.1 transposase [Vibrio parahaemolyticus]